MSRLRAARFGAQGVEIVIGRGLAFCAHPTAAWRRLPPTGRALLVGAYAAASYITVLSLLFMG